MIGVQINRHVRIFFTQFVQLLQGHRFSFPPSAARAHIIDDAGITADRIPVYRMVYGAVSHAVFLHTADHRFESLRVLRRISVQFHITDMARIGQRMIRTFDPDLFKGAYRIIYRYMERISIVLTIRNSRNLSVALLIHPHKTAGQPSAGVASSVKLSPVSSDLLSRYFLM